MKFTTLASFLSFSLAAIAANHDVDVGEDGLVFNPSSISCSGSDTVTFHFYPGGHSVVSSAFNKPCEADGVISSGSGFNPTKGEDKNVFVIDCPKSATYLFCSQFGHCKGGMVAAINAPTSGQTLNAYKSAAGKAADDGGPVMSVSGGKVMTGGEEGGNDQGSGSGGGSSTTSESPPPPPPKTTKEPEPEPTESAPPPEMSSPPAAAPPPEESPSEEPAAQPCPTSAPAVHHVPSPAPVYSAPSPAPVYPASSPAPVYHAPEMSSEAAGETTEAPAPVYSTMATVYSPPTNPPPPPEAAATAAATTAEAAATPSGTTPPAATGDALSHPRSVFAALLVALATVLLLA